MRQSCFGGCAFGGSFGKEPYFRFAGIPIGRATNKNAANVMVADYAWGSLDFSPPSPSSRRPTTKVEFLGMGVGRRSSPRLRGRVGQRWHGFVDCVREEGGIAAWPTYTSHGQPTSMQPT